MDYMELLVDFHKSAFRQGPGGYDELLLALRLSGIDKLSSVKLVDIGCGTGASTIQLARELDADITAVDLFPDFLDVLSANAERDGVSHKIRTLAASMDDLPFADNEFDVIWSEGAVYNIGFEKGVSEWRRFIKSGGFIVVSEITWLTNERPEAIHSHWNAEYPEIGTASEKIAVLERNGYKPVGYFFLPVSCWLDNYYNPMRLRFDSFLKKHDNCSEAVEIVEQEKYEIDLYEKYRDFVSYGFYIAQKV
jgi:SAM-dependent methyltransferase